MLVDLPEIALSKRKLMWHKVTLAGLVATVRVQQVRVGSGRREADGEAREGN
jgi:hypothetical protein